MTRRILTLLLALALVIGLAACTPAAGTTATTAGTTSKTAGTTAAAATTAKKLELTHPTLNIITVPAGAAFPDGVSIMKSEFFDLVVKKSGYQLNWQLFKTGEDTNAQINLLMASGNPPDLIQGASNSTIAGYARDGGLAALDDALEQYGTYLKKFYPKEVLDYCRVNGKLYTLPRYLTNNGFAIGTLAVRKDWLTELGLTVPTTTDELYDVLKKVKAAKPNVIPLVVDGGFSRMFNILGAFGIPCDRSVNYIIENGKASFPYLDDRCVNFIKYMNKLYTENLIDKEFLIDKEAIQKMLSGNGFAMDINYVEIVRQMSAFQTKNPTGVLEYIAPPKGPTGTSGHMGQGFINPMWIVPKTSAGKVADCINFLNPCNADKELLDTFAFGIDGRDSKKNADGTVTKLDNFSKISATKGYYSRLDITDNFDKGNNVLEGFTAPLNFLEKYKSVNEIRYAPLEVPASANLLTEIRQVVTDGILNMIIKGYSDEAFKAMKQAYVDKGGDKVLQEYQAWYATKAK